MPKTFLHAEPSCDFENRALLLDAHMSRDFDPTFKSQNEDVIRTTPRIPTLRGP